MSIPHNSRVDHLGRTSLHAHPISVAARRPKSVPPDLGGSALHVTKTRTVAEFFAWRGSRPFPPRVRGSVASHLTRSARTRDRSVPLDLSRFCKLRTLFWHTDIRHGCPGVAAEVRGSSRRAVESEVERDVRTWGSAVGTEPSCSVGPSQGGDTDDPRRGGRGCIGPDRRGGRPRREATSSRGSGLSSWTPNGKRSRQ